MRKKCVNIAIESGFGFECPECKKDLISDVDLIVFTICEHCQKVTIQCKKCKKLIIWEVPTKAATKQDKKNMPTLDRVIELNDFMKGLLKDQYEEFLKTGPHC